MGKTKTYIIAILAIPILIIGIPIGIFLSFSDGLKLRKFRKENSGKTFLVCTTKRGWSEFINNNLLPVLPSYVTPVWQKSAEYSDPLFKSLSISNLYSTQKPFFVFVYKKEIKVHSLNSELQELKKSKKKSSNAQLECERYILSVCNNHRNTVNS